MKTVFKSSHILFQATCALLVLHLYPCTKAANPEAISGSAMERFSQQYLNKSSLVNAVGQPNDVTFGKTFFLYADTFQHLVYGHAFEDYAFTYWVGKIRCGEETPEDDDVCDDRICKPGEKAYCDMEQDEPYCRCKNEDGSDSNENCDPKLVLYFTMYYHETDEDPTTSTLIRTQNFIATCTLEEGQEDVPVAPKPSISIKKPNLGAGVDALDITISFTHSVQVPELPVYFWTVQSVLIRINKTSLTAIFEKLGTEQLADVIDEDMLRRISEVHRQRKQVNQ